MRLITNYVIGNSDIELADMVDTELINKYDLNEINLTAMIVRTLHDADEAAQVIEISIE